MRIGVSSFKVMGSSPERRKKEKKKKTDPPAAKKTKEYKIVADLTQCCTSPLHETYQLNRDVSYYHKRKHNIKTKKAALSFCVRMMLQQFGLTTSLRCDLCLSIISNLSGVNLLKSLEVNSDGERVPFKILQIVTKEYDEEENCKGGATFNNCP